MSTYFLFVTGCNKTLNATRGVFQSPGFPDKYANGQLCSWMMLVPVNNSLVIQFTHFSLDNTHDNYTDVLEMYDLKDGSFQLNATYTGHRDPFWLTFKTDAMFVFRSKKVRSSVGFRAEYSVFIPPGK